jgi:L-glutamine-phosphate cytidylyltransferase
LKAIILAAGSGQRLLPYTAEEPKCLVEVAGQSLLDRQINVMRSAGIHDITIITGYLGDKISVEGVFKLHNPNYERTNMVSTLFLAADLMAASDSLIVSYGDIVYEQEILERVIACDAPICLPVDVEWERFWSARMDDPLGDAETLKINIAGDVIEVGQKPKDRSEIEAQYIGLMKFDASLTARLPAIHAGLDKSAIYDGKDYANMYMTSFIQMLIDSGHRAEAIKIDNGWLEVDTPEDLELYNEMHRVGTLSQFIDLPQ